jgi:15-cis-phytoene synthase
MKTVTHVESVRQIVCRSSTVASRSDTGVTASPRASVPVARNHRNLDEIMARHAHTFDFASRFLSPERRRATRVLYAFFRLLDDLVDVHGASNPNARSSALSEVEEWGEWLSNGLTETPPDPFLGAHLRFVLDTYAVPLGVLGDFLDGMRADLVEERRVASFGELEMYCYQVAGTVGLAMCPVLGAHGQPAHEAAKDLGIAMQLTNVIRDVGGDLLLNRVYLPLEEIEACGLSVGDLYTLATSGEPLPAAYVDLMRRQISRADGYYAKGVAGISLLPWRTRLPILIAARLYQRILRSLARDGYDSLRGRAVTTRWEKATETVRCLALLTVLPVTGRSLQDTGPAPRRPLGRQTERGT